MCFGVRALSYFNSHVITKTATVQLTGGYYTQCGQDRGGGCETLLCTNDNFC